MVHSGDIGNTPSPETSAHRSHTQTAPLSSASCSSGNLVRLCSVVACRPRNLHPRARPVKGNYYVDANNLVWGCGTTTVCGDGFDRSRRPASGNTGDRHDQRRDQKRDPGVRREDSRLAANAFNERTWRRRRERPRSPAVRRRDCRGREQRVGHGGALQARRERVEIRPARLDDQRPSERRFRQWAHVCRWQHDHRLVRGQQSPCRMAGRLGLVATRRRRHASWRQHGPGRRRGSARGARDAQDRSHSRNGRCRRAGRRGCGHRIAEGRLRPG